MRRAIEIAFCVLLAIRPLPGRGQTITIDADAGAVFDGILDGFPMLAALDGQPDFGGNALGVALRNGATEERGVGEFPLAALDSASADDVASAILTFNIDDVLSTFGPGTDFAGRAARAILVHAYAGNGQVDLDDFLEVGGTPHLVDTTIHGTITDATLRQSGPLVFEIEVTAELRALLTTGAPAMGVVWRTTDSPTGTSLDDLGDGGAGPPGVNGARLPFLTVALQAPAAATFTATATPPAATPTPTDTPLPTSAATRAPTSPPPPTATSTTTRTPRPTATPTPLTPRPTATPAFDGCPGDCDRNAVVSTAELVGGVRTALGHPHSDCAAFDRDGNGAIMVDELVRAVSAALNGC